MKNDTKTATMIAQLEAAALQVFNQYTPGVRDFMPSGVLTLHTIMHHRHNGDRINPTVADLIRIQVESEIARLYGSEPEIMDENRIWNAYNRGDMLSFRQLREIRDSQIQARAKWITDSGINTTIEGDGYKMTFKKYDIFRILENLAKASDYPTSKLTRYAA